MKIDYTKIYPEDMKELISKERLDKIKDDAAIESSRMKVVYKATITDFRGTKATEFAYLSTANKNKTPLEKALIAANIAVNDRDLIDALAFTNYSRETLENYLKALDYLKRKNTSNNNNILNDKEVTLINNVIKRTEILVKAVTTCVGETTPEIVINKVSQIMSFNPELIPEKADIVLETTKRDIHKELKDFPEITEVKYYTTKEDKTTTVNFVCVCDCTYITDMDLANLSEIMEDLRNTFAEKKMLFNYLIVAETKKESYTDKQSMESAKTYYERKDIKNRKKA